MPLSATIKSGYKQTEIGAIPVDWEARPLAEGVKLLSGQHVLARHCNTDGDGVPYITGPADFPEGVIQHTKFTTEPGTVCHANDVLVTVKGSGAGTLVLSNADYCISRQLMAIRVTEWNTRYIYFSLLQDASLFGAAATGLIPGLSRSDILTKIIPLPSVIAEQGVIAEALSDVDELISEVDKLIAKKRDLKQAAMQQLLTGTKRLPGFSGKWEVKRLGELADIRSGGTPRTSQPQFWDGDVPWCTPTDITALDGFKYISDTSRKISIQGLKSSSAEMIPANSIVMTSRATIGKCAINRVPVSTNQGFKNFLPFGSVDAEFLYYLLLMQKQDFISLCGGSTFLEIGKVQLGAFEVHVPVKKSEQTAIAAVLSDLDAEIDALESRRDKTRALKQGMMQELLTGKTRLI
jgi:type I restriction enzyme S subunit